MYNFPRQFYIHAFYYLQQNTIKIVIYTHIFPPSPCTVLLVTSHIKLLETWLHPPSRSASELEGVIPFKKGTVSPSWMNPIMQLRKKCSSKWDCLNGMEYYTETNSKTTFRNLKLEQRCRTPYSFLNYESNAAFMKVLSYGFQSFCLLGDETGDSKAQSLFFRASPQ